MEGIEHRTIAVNGINMHIAEKGQGPVVLLLHGFPELWYSWRHQIVSLASHGYRAVAPDMRGYGGTDAPPSFQAYSVHHIIGDIISLIDSLGQDQVFVVGHDWGAIMAWHLCLFRPDRVKALVNLSVPVLPRNPSTSFLKGFRTLLGDDYYMLRFQSAKSIVHHLTQTLPVELGVELIGGFPKEIFPKKPGEMEAEFARLGAATVVKFFLTLRDPSPLMIAKDTGLGVPPNAPIPLPSWLSEEDITYFASTFEQKGFTGGFNYYRAFDLTWELTAPWTGAQVKVPTKFIVGDLDLVYGMPGIKEYVNGDGFKKDVPFLKEVVVMEGVAHYSQQEKPDEISAHIYDFIKKF